MRAEKCTLTNGTCELTSPPPLPASLDVGFDTYVPKADVDAPLKDVLAALSQKGVKIDGKIVTFRNNLNKLCLTPYQRQDDWEIGVERQENGTVFLQVRETERKRVEEASRGEREQRMCYWGYRFEQLCTDEESHGPAVKRTRIASPSNYDTYAELYPAHEREQLLQRYGRGCEFGTEVRGGGGSSGAICPVVLCARAWRR